MPKASLSLIGLHFGKLSVVSVSHVANKNHTYYRCLCSCGGRKTVYRGNLTSGQTKSCGCLKIKHGQSKILSPTYRSWMSMRARCHSKFPEKSYKGIRVCRRWDNFTNFWDDMGERPPRTTLDRLNSGRGYSKENCRWATQKQQCETRRPRGTLTLNLGKTITFRGRTLSVSRWARRLKISPFTLYSRIKVNWPVEKIITSERYPS